jgi:subtilisin family serine protease
VSAVKATGLPGVTTAGIKTCVIDSGYDLGHEDMSLKPSVSGDDDPLGAGLWTQDPSGHGTHVAGTIGARNNAVGVVGVFPRVPMHIVKVFDGNDEWVYSSDLIAALDRCMAAGAKVINMSLGGGYSQALNAAVQRAVGDGITFAVAAGNSNEDACTASPASEPSAITVGATTSIDKRPMGGGAQRNM